MPKALLRDIPADIHVAATGLTCPGGSESPEKPVGTMVLVGTANGQKLFAERMVFKGTDLQIIEQTARKAARLISAAL